MSYNSFESLYYEEGTNCKDNPELNSLARGQHLLFVIINLSLVILFFRNFIVIVKYFDKYSTNEEINEIRDKLRYNKTYIQILKYRGAFIYYSKV